MVLPGTLYVVATPIGNLEDITLRALRVLREVQLIAAEDTRRTAKLLSHYSIRTPTTSLHQHNEGAKTGRLIERLNRGEHIALVSDAGTPLVSDPGAHFVAAARQAGISVVAVPGASAIMTALAASGQTADAFAFLGFPPVKAKALNEWVSRHFERPHPVTVFYEAPHRIRATLSQLRQVLGDKPILVCRELTKAFEESVVRPISDHLEALENPRGEFTVVVPSGPGTSGLPTAPVDDGTLGREVGQLMETSSISRREAARQVAGRYGLPPNEVYRRSRS